MRSAVPESITPAATSSCSSRCEIGMAAPNMTWCGSGDRTGSPLHTSFPSVVLHAEPEVHNGVLDAGDHNGRAVLQVAVAAEIDVRDRRQRHLVAQADVVSQPREEADPVGGDGGAPLAELEARQADAALDEEAAARRRVEVHRCGDVPHRLRDATSNVLDPYVHLTAQADARFRRATQFDRRGGAPAPGTGVEGAAAAAAQAVGAVAESEGTPEPVARRGLLCRGELRCTQGGRAGGG